MDIKKIKFRRERMDEYTVRHWFDAGTKYLGPIYAVKGAYDYDVYDAEGNRFHFGRYAYPRTLKDVKEWIIRYDENYEAARAEEARIEAERLAEIEHRRNLIEAENRYWTLDAEPEAVKEGDFITVLETVMSKPCNVGDGFVDGVRDPARAKVVHVAEVTNEEFDAAVRDLYSNFKKEWLKLAGDEEHEFGGGYIGGHVSDDPRLDGLDFDAVFGNPENKAIFHETAYVLVHALRAPNRTVLYVNTEGYGYPRYIAKRH